MHKQSLAAHEAEAQRALQSKIKAQKLSATVELQSQEQRLAIADLKQALQRSQQASPPPRAFACFPQLIEYPGSRTQEICKAAY